MKFLKITLKVIVVFIVSVPLIGLFLVRFTDLSIKGAKSKCIVCYNEERGEWTFSGYENYDLVSVDGPYIFNLGNTTKVLSVKEGPKGFEIVTEEFETDSSRRFYAIPINSDLNPVEFKLQPRPFIVDSVMYLREATVVGISDIEGNFDAFFSFLKNYGVIDESYNWTFGDGRLVLNGDFVDRGAEVTQVLWLIYKLESEAREAGGAVHFVLGNHEAMNLQKSIRYWNHKYRALVQQLGDTSDYYFASSHLINRENELIDWLYSKNILVKIGQTLFVHGGISPELVSANLTLEEINAIAKENIDERLYGKEEGDRDALLVMGRYGPLWYRGMASSYKEYYSKAEPDFVNEVCEIFGVKNIAIGHSIAPDVSYDYSGKVIRMDVVHGESLNASETRGLLIENGNMYKIDATGKQSVIEEIAVSE